MALLEISIRYPNGFRCHRDVKSTGTQITNIEIVVEVNTTQLCCDFAKPRANVDPASGKNIGITGTSGLVVLQIICPHVKRRLEIVNSEPPSDALVDNPKCSVGTYNREITQRLPQIVDPSSFFDDRIGIGF